MFSHFLFVLWRDALKVLLRYGVLARVYARWRLRDVSTDVRSGADVEHDLVRLGKTIAPVLVQQLDEGFPEVRVTALRTLCRVDRERGLAQARRLAGDDDPQVASVARQAIQRAEASGEGAG